MNQFTGVCSQASDSSFDLEENRHYYLCTVPFFSSSSVQLLFSCALNTITDNHSNQVEPEGGRLTRCNDAFKGIASLSKLRLLSDKAS